MRRFIKVNNKWIDTLTEQKQGKWYYDIKGIIWCLPYDTMVDYVVGKLQEEADNI